MDFYFYMFRRVFSMHAAHLLSIKNRSEGYLNETESSDKKTFKGENFCPENDTQLPTM